jgi:hypothetical protein
MTESSSALPYPRCADYLTRGKSVCRWPNPPLDMNLLACKRSSPKVTARTVSARFSLSSSPQHQLPLNTHLPHTIQNT